MPTHIKSFFTAILLITFLSVGLNAAIKTKTETVAIPTNITCEPGKNRVETALITAKGVEGVDMCPKNKSINVTYHPNQITAEQIRSIISVNQKPAN